MNVDQELETRLKNTYRAWEEWAKTGDKMASRQRLIDALKGEAKQFLKDVLEYCKPNLEQAPGYHSSPTTLKGVKFAVREMEAKQKELGL